MKKIFFTAVLLSLTTDLGFALDTDYSTKQVFIGCRASIGECQYSCPSRHFYAKRDEVLCNPLIEEREPIACFCEIREDLFL